MILIECVRKDLLRELPDTYAREYAEYKRALRRVEELALPPLSGPGITPLDRVDEAVMALMQAAWEAGAIAGDAFARAELSLDAGCRICDHCRGDGRPAGEDRACGWCGGQGFIAERDGAGA